MNNNTNNISNPTSSNDLLSYSLDQSLNNLANDTNGISFEISQVEQSLSNNESTRPSITNETRSSYNEGPTPNDNNETQLPTTPYDEESNNLSRSLTPSQKLLKANITTQINQSIDTLWNQLFNVPISLEREKRIQQALDFMDAENKAHQTNKHVVKHSFRQIAQFFTVPKSTLYDRTRLKQNGKIVTTPMVKDNIILTKSDTVQSVIPDSTVISNNNSTNTPVLLKNDGDKNETAKETEPLVSISSTPIETNPPTNRSTSIISNQVSINDKAAILADNTTTKKVDNPSDIRYKRYEVQMKLSVSKEFELLDEIRLISQVYGNIISKNQMNDYIKSHVDNKIELGKTWLRSFLNRHKDHIIYGNDKCYNTIPIQLIKEVKGNYDCLRKCIVDDVHYRVTDLKDKTQHVYIICFLPLSNFGVNKNSITICLDISLNDHTVKFVVPPRLLMYPNQAQTDHTESQYEELWAIKEDYSQDKITCINNGIKHMITACVQRHQTQNSNYDNSKPLILFEGFTEVFHWDIKLCEQVLEISDFLTVPWNEHIFRDILFHHFHQKLFQTMEEINLTLSDNKSCHEFNIGIDDYIPSFSHDVFTTFSDALVQEKNYDDEEENISNGCSNRAHLKKDNQLNLSNCSMGEWNISSVIKVSGRANPNNDKIKHSENTNVKEQKNIDPSLGSPIDLAQLSEINFNNFTQYNQDPVTSASWENIRNLINDNEQHLYNQLSHSKDKELLKGIFDKVKKFSSYKSDHKL